jgi:dihydroorotase
MQTMTDSALITCRAVFPDGVRPVSIRIRDGCIESVELAGGRQPVSASLLFPGFIDLHVHAREYPRPESDAALQQWEASCRKETFATAAAAAINGGVTLIAAMPNDPIPPDNPSAYDRKKLLTHSLPCPVVLFAAITPSSEPWDDLPYKVYLDAQPSPVSFTSWPQLESALARYRGCRVFFHAEDPDVLGRFGRTGPRWKTRPPEAETRAVARILELTAKYGIKSHVCHVSSAEAVLMIEEFNSGAQTRVTCEATPHHLFFHVNDDGVWGPGGQRAASADLLECNPPLRTESDRRFLLDALKDGLIDVLASDHAPHTLEDKRRGSPGMPHLDTLGPFAGWLLNECGFAAGRVASILSGKPAELLSTNLERPCGAIAPGYAASFTLLDPDARTLVEGNHITGRGDLKTRCKWSPFEGIPLPASVAGTVVNGTPLLCTEQGFLEAFHV